MASTIFVMWQFWGRGELHRGFGGENIKGEGRIFEKRTLMWDDHIMDFRKICWK